MKNIKKLLIVVMLVLTLFSAVGVNNVYAGGKGGGKNDDAVQNETDDSKGNSGNTGSGTAVCAGVTVPPQLTGIVSLVINIIKIGVPIILVVLGMIDMGKAVASQKEDEIKKGQKILLSRCIAAGITFFVVAIVQLLVGLVTKGTKQATGESDDIWSKCICHFFDACAK